MLDPIELGQTLEATSRQGSPFHWESSGRYARTSSIASTHESPLATLEHFATGFEIRLDDEDAVDLGVLITPDAGLDDLAGTDDSPVHALAARSPEWQRLSRLAASWLDPASPAHYRIRKMFLEFDASEWRAACTERPPVPSVFLSISSEFGWQVEDATTTPDWLFGDALPTLLGRDLPRPLVDDARRCIDALPEEGRFLHAAVMVGRDPAALRLFFAIPFASLSETLRLCAWPGDPTALVELHTRYGPGVDFAQVQIDLFEGVSDRIGIEFSPAGDGWPELLDRLVRDELCIDAKRTALLDWPDVIREPLQPGGWPCTFVRELSHVKIVHQTGHAPRAKAYVTVTAGHQLDLDAEGI